MIKNIAVIGSGVMGSGIALIFAIHGFSVTVNDTREDFLLSAKNRIKESLALLASEETIDQEGVQKALNSIVFSIDLATACHEADFIIEAIPEIIELKHELYKKLKKIIKPSAIVASNTSTFPISLLTAQSSLSERMIITHFFNPAHLVPLVEIVQHEKTRPEVVDKTIALMRRIGKSPVLLNKEIPGFIANRLQTALAKEAFFLLNEGVASAEDIDKAITDGPGFRWAFVGPIEIADFGGLDTWERVFDNVAPLLDQSRQAPQMLRDLVLQGKLGAKSGEGIFKYENAVVDQKIKDRDRHFIRLNKIKNT